MKKYWFKFKEVIHAIYGGPWWKKILVWFGTFILGIILLLGAIDANLLWLFGRSPGFREISNPVTSEASILISADGQQIGKFYNENRTPVEYQEISPIIVRTLIATEDVRFYQHHGIDFQGLFAAVKDMFLGRARGASTITQQLAKNLFRTRTQYSTGVLGKVPGVKLAIIKAKEWIVAIKLEMVFSKEDILTMYLNTVDFGSNAFGIKTACRTYFDTDPAHLNYEQAATLVGLLKATSTYNPRINPINSTNRRNVVLANLFNDGKMYINAVPATAAQLDSIQAIPMVVAEGHTDNAHFGPAPYFRDAVREYIDMLCEEGLIPGYDAGEKLDLYADGLKIYTSLDTHIQKYAEQAALKQMRSLQQKFREHWGNTNPWQDAQHKEIPNFIENIAKKTTEYKYLVSKYGEDSDSVTYYLNQPHTVKVFTYDGSTEQKMSVMDSIRYMVSFLHCGFVAIEPDTREVKAWVGDIDYKSWQYNKVTSQRQPGSTFKLFVYTEAMNQGLTPNDTRCDKYIAYPDTFNGKPTVWAPHNANGYFTGAHMTLKRAFAQSINSVAVQLGVEMGIPNVARTAHAMGIQSKLDETKSLSLGSSDVSLLELVNSYCTVIDEGKYNMPILVTKIEDRDGNVIYEAQLENKQAIPYRSAYMMQEMLRGGLTEPGGTTAALWQYIHPILDKTEFGGKTGTSNNHSDAWFVGVTPGLVAGAWVGGEYRSIHFRTGALGQGSRTALPIFGYFVQNLLQDKRYSKYWKKFAEPKEEIDMTPSSPSPTYEPTDSLEEDSIAMEGMDIEPMEDADNDAPAIEVNTTETPQTETVTQ